MYYALINPVTNEFETIYARSKREAIQKLKELVSQLKKNR
jgi:hypothetical protein